MSDGNSDVPENFRQLLEVLVHRRVLLPASGDQLKGIDVLELGEARPVLQHAVQNLLGCLVEQLEILARVIESQLSRQGDVSQSLLQSEDVPAHPLYSGLVYALDVLGAGYQDLGYQVTETLEDVLKRQNSLTCCSYSAVYIERAI